MFAYNCGKTEYCEAKGGYISSASACERGSRARTHTRGASPRRARARIARVIIQEHFFVMCVTRQSDKNMCIDFDVFQIKTS